MPIDIPTADDIRAIVREELRQALAELQPANERPLTSEDAASALGIAPKTLRAWAAEGRIQGTKQGRSWRFTRAQVEAARSPPAAMAEAVLRRMG
jgi:excisionase family DNA binding protein